MTCDFTGVLRKHKYRSNNESRMKVPIVSRITVFLVVSLRSGMRVHFPSFLSTHLAN